MLLSLLSCCPVPVPAEEKKKEQENVVSVTYIEEGRSDIFVKNKYYKISTNDRLFTYLVQFFSDCEHPIQKLHEVMAHHIAVYVNDGVMSPRGLMKHKPLPGDRILLIKQMEN